MSRATRAQTLELRFRPPYDWPRVLRFLGSRALPGIEAVDAAAYRRTIVYRDAPGVLSVSRHPRKHALVVSVEGAASTEVDDAFAARVASMFDLDADPVAIGAHLSRDPWLAPLVAAAPGLRVPGAWSAFELAVRAIVGQQVSVKAATTIVGRIVARAGVRAVDTESETGPNAIGWHFPASSALADTDLTRIGMPRKRADAVRRIARAIASGQVALEPDAAGVDALREAWLTLPGIGPWTVEYIAMRAWRDADAWPATDLVLMQSIAAREPALAHAAGQRECVAAWQPWRAYAAMHLWNEVADRAGAARGD